jgi:hypothetical protein
LVFRATPDGAVRSFLAVGFFEAGFFSTGTTGSVAWRNNECPGSVYALDPA